jgi:broad specificity phosphatase PhoE
MKSVGLDRIFVSPLGRAQATAKYTSDALGMQSSVEEWTCEVAGAYYHGSPGSEVKEPRKPNAIRDTPGELIRPKQPWPTEKTWDQIDPESAAIVREKFNAIRQCSDKFFANLGYERDAGRFRVRAASKDRVAIFCHNGTISFLLAQLLEIPLPLIWSGFWHAPTAVTTILFEQRSKAWAVPRALAVADTSHLYAAGLQIRPRGILANYH